MAEEAERADAGRSDGRLAAIAAAADASGRPPRDLWNPPFCGDIPMRIARDGSWHYAGSPIARPALVTLFAGILRRESARFVLVTPVEKVGIEVEDAPFTAVALEDASSGTAGPLLRLRTNLGAWVDVDAAHPLRYELGPSGGLKPYVLVRDDLWALLTRPVATELLSRGEGRTIDVVARFGVASGTQFFSIDTADGAPGGDA